MAETPPCPFDAENQFGPRISIDCRAFDFTLLFEDIMFSCVPTAVFLLLVIPRLHFLRRQSVKVDSYKLAASKLSLIGILFVLQVLFAVFRVKTPTLYTSASLPAAILNIIVSFAAACISFLEDQRSIKPSDLLILYSSISTLCKLPQLRSLWLITFAPVCRYFALAISIVTVAILVLESIPKTGILKPQCRCTTREQTRGLWNRALFIWVLQFMHTGYRKSLEVEDIPPVDSHLEGTRSGEKLQAALKYTNTGNSFLLLRTTFCAYGWTCLSAIPPRLAQSCFTFCQPFLITATLDYLQSSSASEPKVYGQGLIGAYVLVYVGLATTKAVYWRQTYRLLTMMRSGLISMIYEQTTGMTAHELSDSAAITLMGTDVERIVVNLRNIHEAWASMLEVGVAIWLLEREVWIACIIPLVISLGSVLAMIPISTRSGQAQTQWIERVQRRLAVTSSMLSNIKTVQMLGLNRVLFNVVQGLREIEVQTSSRFRKLLVWQVALSNISVVLAPFATFTIYAIIAVVRDDESILSSQAFTSLALISLLTNPLLIFCQAMPAIMQAVSCFSRIEEYCQKGVERNEGHDTTVQPKLAFEKSHTLIAFHNAGLSWSPETEPILSGLTVTLRKGITMIIGPVGSGKSTLIEAIVDRNMVRSGSRAAEFSQVAYCPQTPWIRNDTIRNNIIGVLEFDQSRYDFTCWACSLDADLAAHPEGDMRMAGSDGIALSGGQKQRVALARAVYSRLDVVVLDNTFSGTDSKAMAAISDRLFSKDGYFRKTGISVILAVNTYQMLPFTDHILVLDERQISDQGSYEEILARRPEVFVKLQEPVDIKTLTKEQSDTGPMVTEKKKPIRDIIELPSDKKSQGMTRQGSWAVYRYYFRSAGYDLLFWFMVFTVIEAFCSSFQALWIHWWVRANEQQPNKQLGMYLGVYGLILALSILSLIAGCWILFVRNLANTSLNLHFDLLKTALGAPISFFQTVDTGSITNRFSQDLELIDMMLPIYAVNCITNIMTVFIDVLIICAIGKYLAASIPILGVVLFFIQSYYLRTSRQVRLLDIEAKAPLYTHFLETIQGISSIRAFGWEMQLCEKGHLLLNQSQRPFYMLFSIQQWLTLVLDLVVGGIAVVLIATITSLKDRFNAAFIGVALNLLLTLNQNLAQAIKMWTMTETSIGAVTRVKRFVEDTPSEGASLENNAMPIDWLSRGAVEFRDVTAGYHGTTTPILKNITLAIQAGEKIAICGASGSGKTSLVMALLHMLDLQSGSITIDGQNVTSIERTTLRSNINVIPQDPFFMPGTMRFNLDPRERVSDEDLIRAIEKVGLWDRVRANGGLDMDFSTSDWSVGQKQLLSLARAMVVQSPVLVLDEASSSVDWETESKMHDIIDTEFSSQTVIAVVHRFRYINRFDRVALMRERDIVECDTPDVLLHRDSQFRGLYLAMQSRVSDC